MNDVDVSKIKPGDVVGVRVSLSGRSGVYADLGTLGAGTDHRKSVRIHPSAIVSHTPAPRPALKVGDRVRDLLGREREIIWIEHERAYLRPTLRDQAAPYGLLSEVETWERV